MKNSPCATIKREFASCPMGTIYCACCGEWQMLNGRIYRYTERLVAR